MYSSVQIRQALPETLKAILGPAPMERYPEAFRAAKHVIGAWPQDHFLLQPKGTGYCPILSTLNSFQMNALRHKASFFPREMETLFRETEASVNLELRRFHRENVRDGGTNIEMARKAIEDVVNKHLPSENCISLLYYNCGAIGNGCEYITNSGISEGVFHTAAIRFSLPGTHMGSVPGGMHSLVVPFIDFGARIMVVSEQLVENPDDPLFFAHAYNFEEIAEMTSDPDGFQIRRFEFRNAATQEAVTIRDLLSKMKF